MALPALLLAGGKLGLKLLPAIGAVAGAQPGLRRGNLGEAALGAGFGGGILSIFTKRSGLLFMYLRIIFLSSSW